MDCGTNSLRMLVLERADDGTVIELARRLRLVRLGEGVDATDEFAPAAVARTLAALDEYARELAELEVQRVRFVATSAARDARNTAEFLTGVTERLGVAGEIISGAEEAWLSFTGALSGVAAPPNPVLVTDIGGGSTELVLGNGEGVEQAVSLEIGSVRLRERFLNGDPPDSRQIADAVAYVDDQLAAAGIDLAAARSWIGVAGTVTSMAAVHLELAAYDRRIIQGARLDRAAIDTVTAWLCRTPVDRLVSGVLPRLRAEVIAGGALICARIAQRVAPDMIVSETDILDGVAHALLVESDGSRQIERTPA